MSLTCHAFIAVSVDGFIARMDGGLDWLEPFNALDEDHGYDAFISEMDGIIMGRSTFETVLSFAHWPYTVPVIVLSQNLTAGDIPDALADYVAVCDMPLPELLAALTEEGWSRVYVDGGQVLQSFLRDGLLNSICINRVPLLLGQGRPLFGTLGYDVRLNHVSTRSFPSGLVASSYEILG